jgi:hypothetical protein
LDEITTMEQIDERNIIEKEIIEEVYSYIFEAADLSTDRAKKYYPMKTIKENLEYGMRLAEAKCQEPSYPSPEHMQLPSFPSTCKRALTEEEIKALGYDKSYVIGLDSPEPVPGPWPLGCSGYFEADIKCDGTEIVTEYTAYCRTWLPNMCGGSGNQYRTDRNYFSRGTYETIECNPVPLCRRCVEGFTRFRVQKYLSTVYELKNTLCRAVNEGLQERIPESCGVLKVWHFREECGSVIVFESIADCSSPPPAANPDPPYGVVTCDYKNEAVLCDPWENLHGRNIVPSAQCRSDILREWDCGPLQSIT